MYKIAYRVVHETAAKALVPKRVRNVIYLRYIAQLQREAVAAVQPDCIFSTPPIPCSRTSAYSVWMITSARDTMMAFWSLKSLLHYSSVSWDVWLADGGLQPQQIELFERHFPGIRILRREELDSRSREAVTRHPQCHDLRHRRNYAPALKLIDPPLHLSRRFLLLDSDVLFFASPDEIIAAIAGSGPAFHFNMQHDGINSGVVVVDPRAVRLDEVEAFLAGASRTKLKGWTIEQDAYAALSQDCYAPLAANYAVEWIDDALHDRAISCHYIGILRHRFYVRGVPRLLSQDFLGMRSGKQPAQSHAKRVAI